MGVMASQITSLMIVYSTVFSGADQRQHQSSGSLAFVWGIHRGPVNSLHKWPVTWKMFPFYDVIMDKTAVRPSYPLNGKDMFTWDMRSSMTDMLQRDLQCGDGLLLNRQQTITWTNDDRFHWWVQASPGLNELKKKKKKASLEHSTPIHK